MFPFKNFRWSFFLPLTLFFSLFFFTGCLGQKPDDVLQKMTSNMFDVKQMHLSSDVIFGAKNDQKNFEMTMDMESDVDYSDPNVPKSQSSFTYNTGFSNINFQIKGASKMIKKIVYLKFDTLPSLGILGGLKRLTGNWYKIDPEEKTDSSLMANIGDFPFANMANPAVLYGNVTVEERQQLKELAARSKFFIFQEKLEDEEVDAVKTDHYKVTIDKDGVKQFIAEADTILGFSEKQGKNNNAATNEAGNMNVNVGNNNANVDNANKNSNAGSATNSGANTNAGSNAVKSSAQLTDLLQYIDTSDVQLWIGKKDMLLRKASGTVTLTDTASALSSFSPNVSFTFLMSQYGVPVSVEAPSDAKSFQEFISDSLQGASE